MSVTTDPAEEAELLEQALQAASTTSRLEKAEALGRRLLEIRRQGDDRSALALAIARLGRILSIAYKTEEAIGLMDSGWKELADLGTDDPAYARLTAGLASASVTTDDRRALELFDSMLEMAQRRDLTDLIMYAFNGKSNALMNVGRRRESLALKRAVKDLAAESGDTAFLLRASVGLALMIGELDVQAGLDEYSEALALARRSGHRDIVIGAIANRGYNFFLSGDWETGSTEMESLLSEELSPADALFVLNNYLVIKAARGEDISERHAQMERLGQEMSGPTWHLFLADVDANVAMAAGDLEAAATKFDDVAKSDPSQISEFGYRVARTKIWARNVAAAREQLERLDKAGGYGPMVAARRNTARAGVAALEGRTTDALALYRDALRGWHDVHNAWDEALTGIDMAELLDSTNSEVAAAIEVSRATFERLGARPYVERLDAAIAHGGAPASAKTTKRAAAARTEATPA